jgi:tetratricopeptide (TPR) repeat protein
MNLTAEQTELATHSGASDLDARIEEACRLHDAAVAACDAGQSYKGEKMFRRALALFEQTEGADHPDVAATLGNLGAVYEGRCDYAQAQECFERAARIVDEIADDGGEDLAELRLQASSNLGRILRTQGRYAEAEPSIRRALEFAEQRFGPDSMPVAWALNDLGMLGKFAGWFDQSEACYRRALAILEKHFGPDSAQSASLYHNLGGLEHARGRYEEGEPFARKSVELRERALGPDHTDVAADLAALAALLDGQGKLDEAEQLYLRALKIFRRAYGEEHYEIAVNLNNLAAIYAARGLFIQAEETYLRALVLKGKLFGGDNVDVALTVNNLGVLYKEKEDYEKAAELFHRALAVFEAELAADHPHTVICRENYEDAMSYAVRGYSYNKVLFQEAN